MKKVFIVIEKYFFTDGNTDYAAAIDNEKIVVCKNRESANDWMKRKTEMLRDIYSNSVKRVEKSKDGNSNQIILTDGCRTVVEIIEKNLL